MTGLAAGCIGQLRRADSRTRVLLDAVDAALEAVAPDRLVIEALTRHEGGISMGGRPVPGDRVVVLAFGKAALGMCRGADRALGGLIDRGLVVSDREGEVPEWAELVVGGHPIPDEGSLRAAVAAIDLVEGVAPGELLLALASGGGSTLLEAPVNGLSLDDVRDLNDRLLRSGAPIEIMNQVRRGASRVKGGRLAARCDGKVATLVISDVGRDPAVVASGPTVAIRTAGHDIADILDRFSIGGPAAERARRSSGSLNAARAGPASRPEDAALTLADGSTAGKAAVDHLTGARLPARLSDHRLTGPVAGAVRHALRSTPEGEVGVMYGETTVEVTGNGRGGRNQHAALIAALEISGTSHRFLAFGTDGVDGPTDAAGGYVDGATVTDPDHARRYLARCDSYPYLHESGALLRTGSTGTNVADLWIVDKSGQSHPHPRGAARYPDRR